MSGASSLVRFAWLRARWAALLVVVAPSAQAQTVEPAAIVHARDRTAVQIVRPSFRVAAGIASHPIGMPGGDPWFAFETQLGVVLAVGRERSVLDGFVFAFRPEIGLAYDGAPHDGGARFTTGVGVGIHSVPIAAFWVPQFVAGSSGGGTALGVRNALRIESLFGAVGVEVAHQFLTSANGPAQSIEVVFALDPGIAVTYFRWLMARWD